MIDPKGPIPVYRQIADVLAARIESGELAEHRPIPSEAAIVQEFGVARTTARHAVAHLRERGLIYTVPQRGSYVGQAPPAT
jgi:DNA-binding GntR family transcriptional regulator